MTKINFILSLQEKLSNLPRKDVEERLGFYSEMIEDRMEDGLSEEEAVAAVGPIDEIATLIRADIAPGEPVKERKTEKKTWRIWEIVLLTLGSPIWLSLLIAVFAVAISLYAVLWSVAICLWAAFASVVCSAFGLIAAAIAFVLEGGHLVGLALFAGGLTCAGLAILLLFGSKAATKGVWLLTKMPFLGAKKRFVDKESV